MENRNHIQLIENHYHRDDLYEAILSRLRLMGVDLSEVSRKHLSGVDEFHVRGAEVSKELVQLIDMMGKRVLDIGSGLGGPCRMLADEFNCVCTGIDLSDEFVRTARQLSELVGLDKQTHFVRGDATQLPFEDQSFDVAWTQHVQMNVKEKEKFYSEIQRILKPGGHFLYYDIFETGSTEITYPMPWATHESHSFLIHSTQMHDILNRLGLSLLRLENQTDRGIEFFERQLNQPSKTNDLKLGLDLIMGNSAGPKLKNLFAHLQKGALVLESGVYVK